MPSIIGNVIGRKQPVTPLNHGKYLLLSDTGQDMAGVWVCHFVPDVLGFTGNLSVQARIQGQQAFEDQVALAPVPFKCAILNGAISDYSWKTATDFITGFSLFYIPATGFAAGFLVDCTAGKGVLYTYPRQGDGMVSL